MFIISLFKPTWRIPPMQDKEFNKEFNKEFDEAFDEVVGHEGGYVNNPRDPGGETKYGISKRAYPHLDIKNLTLDDAKAIYYKDYWLKSNCEKLPAAIRIAVLDFAVNSGVKTAITKLQTVLRVNPDGKVGPKTISAATNNFTAQALLARYLGERLKFIADLKNFDEFGRGWARRIAKQLDDV